MYNAVTKPFPFLTHVTINIYNLSFEINKIKLNTLLIVINKVI